MKAIVNWIEGFRLEGHTEKGKVVKMDSGENAAYASPAELILQALAGCTMMDCILILTKARKSPENFWIEVEAEETNDFPKIFSKINLTYNFVGKHLKSADVERAVELSHEKYCRVYAMLSEKVRITFTYNIHHEIEV
jgi:putative redox protein